MLSRQLAESILCARPATDCLDLLPRRSTQFPIEKQKMGLRELQNDAQPLHKKSDELNVQGIKGLISISQLWVLCLSRIVAVNPLWLAGYANMSLSMAHSGAS
jgi:hypothetical protein